MLLARRLLQTLFMPIPSPPLFGPFDTHRERRSLRGTTLRLQSCSPLDAVFAHRGRSVSGPIGCESPFCLRALLQQRRKCRTCIAVLEAAASFSSPAATISAGPTPVPDANRESAYFDFGCCCCCCNCCNCWSTCCGVSTPLGDCGLPWIVDGGGALLGAAPGPAAGTATGPPPNPEARGADGCAGA